MAEFETRYATVFDYTKHVDDTATVTVINRINLRNNQSFPLMHAADISIGDDESLNNRLNVKLASIDIILRELYGVAPSVLEAYTDGRTAELRLTLAADGGVVGAVGAQGMESLARLALILNNRTETVDDRIADLKIVKSIVVGSQGTDTTDTTEGTGATLIADNNSDTVTISSENKWIILKADDSNDSFTIGHYKAAFNATSAALDLNNTGTFIIPILDYDLAGHIISRVNTTYTLPYNYKTIALSNAASNATAAITKNETSVVANSQVETVTFIAGNIWIELAGETTNSKTVTFAHKISDLAAGAHASNWSLSAQAPTFGATFNVLIPSVSFTTDAAGHVTAYAYSDSTSDITLPRMTVSDTIADGNVIVGLSVDAATVNGVTTSTGSFSTSRANIGSLLLTDYSAPNLPTDYVASTGSGTKKVRSSIVATNSLNTAIAMLQSYAYDNLVAIESEIAERASAISDLVDNASASYNTLGKIETIISNHLQDISNPHSVTKTQVGLSNVTNDQQIKALANELQTTQVGRVALWNAKDELSISDYTLGKSVPADAILTAEGINELIDAALENLINDFSMTLKMPVTAVWNTDEHGVMPTATAQDYPDAEIEILKLENDQQVEIDTNDPVDGTVYVAVATRTVTIGEITYTDTVTLTPTHTYVDPEPEDPEPEEPEPEEPGPEEPEGE